MGCADHIVELYGVRRFLADIDRDRQFWRDGDHLIGEVLSFIADEAFEDFFRRFKVKAANAHAHRQRYLIEAALSIRLW